MTLQEELLTIARFANINDNYIKTIDAQDLERKIELISDAIQGLEALMYHLTLRLTDAKTDWYDLNMSDEANELYFDTVQGIIDSNKSIFKALLKELKTKHKDDEL